MVSVILVTKDRQSLLESCLVSLSNQTRTPEEVVVVDNNSMDNTRAVVKGFSKKFPYIKYFCCKKIGIPYTRNMGVDRAKYNILAWLDDDCIPENDWYENVCRHKALTKHFVIQGGATNADVKSVFSTALFYLNQRNLHVSLFSSSKSFNQYKIIDFFDTKNFVITKNQIKKIGHFFEEKHILAGDLFFQNDLKNNNINILYLPGIDVKHKYMTSLPGYLNKIKWAKKCKNIFGKTNIIETSSLSKAKELFPKIKIKSLKEQYKRSIEKIESDFFASSSKQLSFSKKIILRLLIYSTQIYLNK